jgi:hypothetical protein
MGLRALGHWTSDQRVKKPWAIYFGPLTLLCMLGGGVGGNLELAWCCYLLGSGSKPTLVAAIGNFHSQLCML